MKTFRFEIFCKDDAWRFVFCRSGNASDPLTGSQIITTEAKERAYVAYGEECAQRTLSYFTENANGATVRLSVEQKKTRVKSVEWSYPSSDNAKRFGKTRTGCWTVQVGYAGEPLEAITAHAERDGALHHAHSLGMEWCSLFRSAHPDDCAKFQPFCFAK